MFRNYTLRISAVLAALATLAIILVACGGGSTNQNLSPAQAQAVSQQLFSALGSAMVSGFGLAGSAARSAPASLASAIPTHPATSSSNCVITDSGESCNIPITSNSPCPNGGTIAVSGDFVFTLDNSGNGSDSSTLTVTPTNCAVSNITFNGNPNVTVSTGFTLQNNTLAYPILFSEKGGITFGPKPSGSCSINVTMTVNSPTSCTATGTVCGHSVSGRC